MDGQFAANIIKIIVFLPIVLLLAFISLKIGGSRMMKIRGGRIIKIIEKVPLSNRSFLCVVLINDKPYALSCSDEKVEVLMELPSDSIASLKEDSGFIESFISNFKTLCKRKDMP